MLDTPISEIYPFPTEPTVAITLYISVTGFKTVVKSLFTAIAQLYNGVTIHLTLVLKRRKPKENV